MSGNLDQSMTGIEVSVGQASVFAPEENGYGEGTSVLDDPWISRFWQAR
jgi:hypothetical protein